MTRLDFLGWSLAALLAALHAWMLHRYAVDFPRQDDFTQILVVPGYFDRQPSWADKIAYVFSLSIEHRIATFRLLALVQAKLLGQLDFRALIFWGNALCAAAGILVLSRADRPLRPWLAPVFAALLFSPTNVIAQYWTTGALAHLGLVAYAFGALFCATRRGVGWAIAAALLAVAAAFTVSAGIMVFPVAAAALWLTARRRAALAWGGATLVLFSLYFVGYETPAGRLSVLDVARHPLHLALLSLAVLGSMTEHVESAASLGAVLLAAWGALLVFRSERKVPPELIAWMAFLLLTCAAVALGRAALGADALVTSRYRIYSEMAVLVTLLAILGKLDARWSVSLAAILVPCALGWFAYTWETNLPSVAEFSMASRNSRDHYALDAHGIYYGFPPQDFGDFMLKRAADEGYFRAAPAARPAPVLQEAAGEIALTAPASFWAAAPLVDDHAIAVRGFAGAVARQVALCLRSDGRTYLAALPTQRMIRTIGASDRTIFWGVIPLRGVKPGRYRVGYVIRTDRAAGLVLTEDWADIL